MEGQVPVHVDHEHIERNIILAKALHEIVELLIAVRPVTGPPSPKSEPWRQWDLARDSREIGQCLLVVVAISEEIPILPLARGALDHPGPRTVLALAKAEVGRIEKRTRRIVHHGPT